jgi:glycosyltransferase involved in cell wall biosynthesis
MSWPRLKHYRQYVVSWPVEREAVECGRRAIRDPWPDRKRLLLVGRLHPLKRILETVEAFAKIARSDWELVIAGPPSNEIKVEDVAAAAGSQWNKRIHYAGSLGTKALYDLYSSATALILLSHRENFGFVVAEAMAFGVPVITSTDVDLSGVIQSSGAGLALDVRNQADVEEAVRRAIDLDPCRVTEMAAAGRRLAETEFAFERFAAEYGRILADVMRRHEGGE